MERYIRCCFIDKHNGRSASFCNPISDFGLIKDTFDGSEPGDRLELELVEMTVEEYGKLGEFEGF